MNIPYPSDDQIRAASQKICREAVPQRETILSFVKNMTTHMGLKNIFYGTYDTMAIAVSVFLAIGMAVPAMLPMDEELLNKLTVFVFAFSPMLFMVLYTLSYWKELGESVYPIKMTCKYTVHHLLAYRMLAASLASVVFNSVYVAVLCSRLSIPGITMVCISLSALFLFSLLLIMTVLRFHSLHAVIGLCVGWLLANAAIGGLALEAYAVFLQAVPVGVWIVLDVILVAAYMKCCGVYLNRRMHYANG